MLNSIAASPGQDGIKVRKDMLATAIFMNNDSAKKLPNPHCQFVVSPELVTNKAHEKGVVNFTHLV